MPKPIARSWATRRRAGILLRLGGIGAVLAAAGGGFAYTGGWLTPGRLSPERVVDALGARGGDPAGHRRNHSKGVCFTGHFDANGAGSRLSKAPMLAAAGSHPVVGRFAIAVGDPAAPDAEGRVRSMAVRVTAPDGQEWRSGMNSSPVFPVATPQAFYEQTVAARVDPATGKPDPEAAAFDQWASAAPWTRSYADQTYNSLNAFRFVDASGMRRAVRWSMQATTPESAVAPRDLAALGPDFLEDDLHARLAAAGPLRWRLVVTLAAPGDPTNDATRAWPEAGREQVEVGTLVVDRAEDEASGPCRDVNYDPLVLPDGIEPSDDPILLARPPAYANSYDRREAETGRVTAAGASANAAGSSRP